jgi:hypothetical protein
MKKTIIVAIAIALIATMFASCKKDDPVVDPVVTEEELITTMKLTVSDTSGGTWSFIYKVENGFGSSSQGTVQIDTIKLAPAKVYTYSIEVLNESENPVENITEEVLEEKDEHLFLIISNPASGAGSLASSEGSKDNQNLPFNQTGKFTAGAAGTGTLTISLLHEPTNKNGTTTAATGGSTDAEAVFPVMLQ